jgi:hypothetical protein
LSQRACKGCNQNPNVQKDNSFGLTHHYNTILLTFIPRGTEKEYSMVFEMQDKDDQGKKMEEVRLKSDELRLLRRLMNITIIVDLSYPQNEAEVTVTEEERNNFSMTQVKNENICFW